MADEAIPNPLALLSNSALVETIGVLHVGCLRTRAVPSRRNRPRVCALLAVLDVERQNRELPPVLPPYKG